MSDAISVGPSLDILEETPETPIVEVAPAKSREDAQDPEKPEVDSEADPEKDKDPDPETDPENTSKPKKMGAEGEDPESDPEADPESDPEEPSQVDVAKFTQEYYDNDGELSEESYQDLEKRGFPKDMVDTFMAGIEALQTQRGDSLHEIAGGTAEYH